VPFSDTIGINPDSTSHMAMALMTYEEPAWNTAENQAKAKREFRNKIELDCYKSLQK
jgi:hypothetical protein